jgi:hypothetical protein
MKTFILEERPHEYAGIQAERVRFDSGSVIFENGDIFSPELVLAQAAGTWLSVHIRKDDDECECDHEEDE